MQQYQGTHFCSAATFCNIFYFVSRYHKFVRMLGIYSPEFSQFSIDGTSTFSNKDKSSVETQFKFFHKLSYVFGLLSCNTTGCVLLSSVKFLLFGHKLRFVYDLKHVGCCTLEMIISRIFRNSAYFPLFLMILKISGDNFSVQNQLVFIIYNDNILYWARIFKLFWYNSCFKNFSISYIVLLDSVLPN
jgi:hypothetical protein